MPRSEIAVLGSLNEDFINHIGKEKHSFGGILYNLAALSILLPDSRVRPVAFLGTNVWPKAARLTQNFRRLDWGSARKLKRKTNRVHLSYLPSGEKREILKYPVPAFAWRMLAPVLCSDGLLLNFISGWEISPALFKKLRARFSGLIYVDLHSLLLGMKKDGERFSRLPKDWETFLHADFVQMNQKEWELVSGLPFRRENLIHFCNRWEKKKWRAVIVTLAEKGAFLVCRDGALTVRSCPAPNVRNPEQTGAGDFFSAGFLSAVLQGKDLHNALQIGVQTASWKCRYEGIEAVLKHRKELRRILTATPRRSKLAT